MTKMKFEIKILKRKQIYITVTDATTGRHTRRCVKYKPDDRIPQRIPTNMAISSIIGQLIGQHLDAIDNPRTLDSTTAQP